MPAEPHTREPKGDWTDEYFWMFGREPQPSFLDVEEELLERYLEVDLYSRELADLRGI